MCGLEVTITLLRASVLIYLIGDNFAKAVLRRLFRDARGSRKARPFGVLEMYWTGTF